MIEQTPCKNLALESLRRLLVDEEAVATVEYAYLLGVIALGVVAGLTFLSDNIIELFTSTGDQLDGMVD